MRLNRRGTHFPLLQILIRLLFKLSTIYGRLATQTWAHPRFEPSLLPAQTGRIRRIFRDKGVPRSGEPKRVFGGRARVHSQFLRFSNAGYCQSRLIRDLFSRVWKRN